MATFLNNCSLVELWIGNARVQTFGLLVVSVTALNGAELRELLSLWAESFGGRDLGEGFSSELGRFLRVDIFACYFRSSRRQRVLCSRPIVN